LGKFSIALEKAKDEDIRETEPRVETTAVKENVEPAKEAVQAPEVRSAPENPSPAADNTSVSDEMSGWDKKLREVTSGDSKHVAESIRMLRTKIFYPDEGEPPRSILVTSAIPGEGKSFVCANLAISIAQGIEKEALIVECDMRKPNLKKLFGLKSSRGLVDFLQSGTPVEQLIQQTTMPKLTVLSSGKPPKNPAELLDTMKMASLIETLENHHPDRMIIFDSPPMQSASETDILAKRVDKVILVIRWGFARREHVKQLVDMIGRDKILGVVFNAFEMSRIESKLQGYYYGYKDYYSYSYANYHANEKKLNK
jgi:capsular exopolysaccharide synthesis family protein